MNYAVIVGITGATNAQKAEKSACELFINT